MNRSQLRQAFIKAYVAEDMRQAVEKGPEAILDHMQKVIHEGLKKLREVPRGR